MTPPIPINSDTVKDRRASISPPETLLNAKHNQDYNQESTFYVPGERNSTIEPPAVAVTSSFEVRLKHTASREQVLVAGPGQGDSQRTSAKNLTMDPMLFALVNSQNTDRAVRDEFNSLKFDLKLTDLSDPVNPFVIFKHRGVDKNGYLIFQDELETFLKNAQTLK